MKTRPGGKGKKFGGFKGAPKGGKKFGSYLTETWGEYEADTATDEAYYQENDEESEELEDMYVNLAGMAEDDEMMDEEDDYTDAMVAYQSAKKRFAVAKKAGQRGFAGSKGKGAGKSDSLADKKAKSRCADCGRLGRWHGDEICEKVKKGEVQAYRPKKGAGKR